MPTTKQPTIRELAQDIRSLQATATDHETRIGVMETAKIQTDAVAAYLMQHPAQTVSESNLNKQILKYLGWTLLIIATLVGASGIKP